MERWTSSRAAVHGGCTAASDKVSSELSPLVATVSESSPWLGKLGEGNDVKLTRGFRGRCGNGGRPAAEKQIGGGFFSQTRSSEPRDENCGKGLWGRRGWCAAPFIGSREVR
jgi:hypothetical protein